MKLTSQLIHEHAADGIGWNRPQLESLGVKWPLKSGWIRELEGKEISLEQWRRFVELRGVRKKKERAAIAGGQGSLL
jgi:hypothetical protein